MKKRIISITMAMALTLSLSTTAFATGGGGTVSDAEREANGNTTISIMQATVNPLNVSYTVPLYVTMAVVGTDTDVKVPTNYAITNTSSDPGGGAKVDIGVTHMSFEKLTGSTYKTVASAAAIAGDEDNIFLQIGSMTMPTLAAPGTAPVDMTGGVLGTAASPTVIARGASQVLLISGTVATASRATTAAAAQFRVKYTVSLLTDAGAPLGVVYAGDDRTQAGLPPFTP